jgi:predicted metal-dependent enzyme (double-stranded beta helix superfamily)
MALVAYDLAAFTQDLDDIVARQGADPTELTRSVQPRLSQLLADTSWLDPRCAASRGHRSVQYLLHRHPADAYTIVSVVFPVGYSTPVHDHTTWGLVGVWRGEEQEERFVRVDDRSSPERAQLKPVGTVINRPIAVSRLVPPNEEIHRIQNLGSQPACSIHVYGGYLHGLLRHSYDLETGAIEEFRTSVIVPNA